MRWGEVNTLNFVKVYLEQECLWNPAHEWYKNKYNRDSAYSEIIRTFKTLTGKCMTIPEVKTKIKSLRSTYTQQVQKILQKSSPDSIYEPSLIWFHEMDRCIKYAPNEKSRTTAADSSQETHDVDSDLDHAWCDDKTITSSLEENADPLIPSLNSDNEYDTSATHESAVVLKIDKGSSPEYPNLYLKRKRRKPKKPSQYFIKSQIEAWTQEDEFDVYGKYIATQLRQMDLQRALKVQLQIQNLIKEARISISND